MSKFSGKCDIYDDLIVIREMDDSSDWSKIELYQYDENSNMIKLDIKNIKDLTPYYPYIITSAASNKDYYRACISSISYVDIEYREKISLIHKNAKREYMRCKRKGIPFDEDEVARKIKWSTLYPSSLEKEICRIVSIHPYAKLNFNELDDCTKNWKKESLVEEMIKVGYTKKQAEDWCYKRIKTW